MALYEMDTIKVVITDKNKTKPIIVAAIDFGTTYSGYAFSFLHEYEANPLNVTSYMWNNERNSVSYCKTASAVLLKNDLTLDAFGYDAEEKYLELSAQNNTNSYHFIRNFKMNIYNQPSLSKHTIIETTAGASIPLFVVCRELIRALKDHFLSHLKSKVKHVEIKDILWVLTVPAIWPDSSKQFMREAALGAGLNQTNFILALEPEVASLYCKHQPITIGRSGEQGQLTIERLQAGNKHIVLDIGGGTVDVTVHKITETGNLEQIYAANGGPWGGTKVDESFIHFLHELYTQAVFEEFTNTYPNEQMEFLKEFEYRKVLIEPNSDKYVRLRCPSYLKEIYCKNNKEKFPESGKYGDTVKWSSDYGRLIINSSVIENMITKVVNHTVNHLQTILREPAVGQVSAIMVVGGFGTSKVLQHILLQSFPQQNFVFPADAPKAVLYGAVMYGHRPDAIFARICSSTYGIGQFRRFDAKIHEPSKKEVVNGVEWCKDCFIKFIEEGAKVIAGESKFTTTLTAVSPFQGELVVPIYVSKQDKNPLYVTDSGVEYIGELVVEMLNDVGTGNRRVQVTIEMGGTELNVSGKNVATGKSYKATLQFLTR